MEETSSAKSYRISKRGIEDAIRDVRMDYKGAKERDVRVYIAAQLPRDHPYRTFVVGDNKTYEGYYNAPLEPRRDYSIWYGAYTISDGVRSLFFYNFLNMCFIIPSHITTRKKSHIIPKISVELYPTTLKLKILHHQRSQYRIVCFKLLKKDMLITPVWCIKQKWKGYNNKKESDYCLGECFGQYKCNFRVITENVTRIASAANKSPSDARQ